VDYGGTEPTWLLASMESTQDEVHRGSSVFSVQCHDRDRLFNALVLLEGKELGKARGVAVTLPPQNVPLS